MAAESLYQKIILDGSRDTAYVGALPSGEQATVSNPLCGDEITLYAELNGSTLDKLSYACTGCAICKASASVLAKTLTGKSTDAAKALSTAFQASLTGHTDSDLSAQLEAFQELKNYPTRKRCGTLPWEALDLLLKVEK